MSRVLFTLGEPLFRRDGRMAGLQIRTYEMARALAGRGHDVVVLEPEPGSPPGCDARQAFRLMRVPEWKSAGPADVWIAHPLNVRRYWKKLSAVPLVVDGYESPFGSFLAHSASLLPRLGSRVMYDYRNTIVEFLTSLSKADRVLCGSENQRACYLTLLSVLGTINPRFSEPDMVLTLQSGAPVDLPPPRSSEQVAVYRAPDQAPTVLWMSGVYPWFDIPTYLAAMPLVLERFGAVQFLFAGIGGVDCSNGEASAHSGAGRVREFLNANPLVEARTRLVDWIPYAERGRAFSAADVGICTYREHIETTFSMRARIIDMIWGGLPVIANPGDSLSRTLEAEGIGVIVPPGRPTELADAVVALLKDPARRTHMSARARELATGALSWGAQVEPLHQFCLHPHREPSRRNGLVKRSCGRIVRINSGLGKDVMDGARRVFWRLHRLARPLHSRASDV